MIFPPFNEFILNHFLTNSKLFLSFLTNHKTTKFSDEQSFQDITMNNHFKTEQWTSSLRKSNEQSFQDRAMNKQFKTEQGTIISRQSNEQAFKTEHWTIISTHRARTIISTQNIEQSYQDLEYVDIDYNNCLP